MYTDGRIFNITACLHIYVITVVLNRVSHFYSAQSNKDAASARVLQTTLPASVPGVVVRGNVLTDMPSVEELCKSVSHADVCVFCLLTHWGCIVVESPVNFDHAFKDIWQNRLTD